jgi:ubiquinol-cytochrome c reductase cytochrome c subunit
VSDIIHEDRPLRRSLRRWEMVGAVVMLLLVVSFPLYKAVESSRRADALASEEAALISSGHQLWGLNCATCHGSTGQGVDAPALNSQQFLTAVSDEQMHGIVAGGVPGTAMPAWWNEYGGPLTDQQIAAIVAYVRSWEKTAPSRPDWRNPIGSAGS